MAAVDPGAYGPPPHEINNRLIEAVHHAIGAHPNPLRKASYGKMLAMLLGEQAREHQAHMQTSGSAGSSSAPPQHGMALPEGDPGPMRSYGDPVGGSAHGAVGDQGAPAAGPPPNWAAIAAGHPPVSPLVEAAAAAIAHGIHEPVNMLGHGPMPPQQGGFSPLAEAAAHALAGGRLSGGYREQF